MSLRDKVQADGAPPKVTARRSACLPPSPEPSRGDGSRHPSDKTLHRAPGWMAPNTRGKESEAALQPPAILSHPRNPQGGGGVCRGSDFFLPCLLHFPVLSISEFSSRHRLRFAVHAALKCGQAVSLPMLGPQVTSVCCPQSPPTPVPSALLRNATAAAVGAPGPLRPCPTAHTGLIQSFPPNTGHILSLSHL